jgi:hypothetical protein
MSFAIGQTLSRIILVSFYEDDMSPFFIRFRNTFPTCAGAFALLGSVSFFAGVTRLTMSLTVIMVEITNDIHQLLLIMISIMVAKWTGDLLTHPLYHALLEFKCIPFLAPEPILLKADGSVLNLDLFTAQDAMTHPVKTVNIFASVHSIAKILLGTVCTVCTVCTVSGSANLISNNSQILFTSRW